MEFQFRLTPVEDIVPWGGEQEPATLSWYGLTDGWFWIEIGGQELFRYSLQALRYRERQEPGHRPAPLPYENYQVARYWEDLLALLPAVLDPLPADLAARVADAPSWTARQQAALQWQEAQADDAAWDTYYTALGWWGDRTWDAGHLAFPPRLALWRVEETVHVRWDNRQVTVEGTPVWTAPMGEATLPVSEFVTAVMSFHHRFLMEMKVRVKSLTAIPLPDVEIDLAALCREQQDRSAWITTALRSEATPPRSEADWDEVRSALQILDPHLL
jgi:hypothetical protein